MAFNKVLPRRSGYAFAFISSIVTVVFLCLPVILGFLFVYKYGVNVVWLDQWLFVQLLSDLFGPGSIGIGELFSQHNEHRLFFPRIIMLLLATVTGYNVTVEMYFSLVLVSVNLLIIFYLYKKDHNIRIWKINVWKALIPFVPVPWLLFSFRQYINFLFGWDLQIFLAVFGVMVTLLSLEVSEGIDKAYIAAHAGGVFSAFSYMLGLAVWPMGIIYLLLNRTKDVRKYMLWLASAVFVYWLYFWGWTDNTPIPLLHDPFQGIKFFFVNVGSPLTYTGYYAGIIGFLVLILTLSVFTLSITEGKLEENSKWLSLIAFSFGSSFVLTIGRGALGVRTALLPKYTSITLLSFVGLYLASLNTGSNTLFIQRMSEVDINYISKVLQTVVLVMIITGIVLGYSGSISKMEEYSETLSDHRKALLCYENKAVGGLGRVNWYFSTSFIRDKARVLDRYNLNVFAGNKDC